MYSLLKIKIALSLYGAVRRMPETGSEVPPNPQYVHDTLTESTEVGAM